MSTFTETKVIDQITVTENGTVFYREATRVLKDNEEISKIYHRSSLTPAQDLTGIPTNVVAICNVAWTQEVISAYQAQVAQELTNRQAQTNS
jgi:DNA-binding transcriptional LysR family regulator